MLKGPSIHCRNLGLRLGGEQILHDIDLTIEAGSIHCLIGPNGGGKTSLVRCLLGQMSHTGDVELQSEQSIVTGYVPQFLDFDKALPVTVLDFMAIVCNGWRPAFTGLTSAAREQAEQALQRVGLEGRRKTRLGSLSGGERQRVLVAQALIPEPSFLVLDEPMNNMDRGGEENLLELIGSLAKQGVTIVWIAHDLGQVKEMADKLSCINRTIVYSGPPAEFLDSMQAHELFHLATGKPLAVEADA